MYWSGRSRYLSLFSRVFVCVVVVVCGEGGRENFCKVEARIMGLEEALCQAPFYLQCKRKQIIIFKAVNIIYVVFNF